MAAPAGGCVRDVSQPQSSDVLLTSAGPTSASSGCTGSSLGRPIAVPVPSDATSTACSTEAPAPSSRRSGSQLPKKHASSVVSYPGTTKPSSRSRSLSSSSREDLIAQPITGSLMPNVLQQDFHALRLLSSVCDKKGMVPR